MKIISFLCTFNDWEYLDQTLTSFKDYPDKLFIIEGSWKSSQKFGACERSNQLTYDIIDKHVDNKKVFLVQANEARERNQRQVGLEIAKQEKADWCHMLDSDEVYNKNSLKLIKTVLKNSPDYMLGYRVKSWNFINSFKKWYDGDYQRIYRVTPKAEFYMDNDVRWPDKDGVVGPISSMRMFHHYSYVKLNSDSFWLKMKYQNEQDPTFWERYIKTGQYNHSLLKNEYKIADDLKIFEFVGKHPSIMKNHEYVKKNIFGAGEVEYG